MQRVMKQGEQGEKGGKVHREQPGRCRHKCGAHRSWTHSSGPGATEKVANWSSSQEDFFVSWGTELRFFFQFWLNMFPSPEHPPARSTGKPELTLPCPLSALGLPLPGTVPRLRWVVAARTGDCNRLSPILHCRTFASAGCVF